MELSIDNPIFIVFIAVLLSIIVASVTTVFFFDISNEQFINLDNQDYEAQNNGVYTRLDALKDVSICFGEGRGYTVAFRDDSNISIVDILELDNKNTTLNNATVYKSIESPNKVTKINESGTYMVKSVTESGKTAYLFRLII